MVNIGGSNKVVTMAEAADYLSVAYKTFMQNYKREWKIPHHKYGKHVMFRERDLESFLARTRIDPKQKPPE